jgi:uncharacterized protein YggE
LAAAVLASAWFFGQGAVTVAAQASNEDAAHNPAQTITVVGQGTTRAEPDVARITIGVETTGETVNEAVAENETRMAAVLDALKAEGIKDSDIQTTHYSIQVDRYPEPTPRALAAEGGEAEEAKPTYRVSNMANVTVRDLDTVGDVLDAVVEAGANSIWGVNFTLDDPEAAQAEARADAVADAQARAEALAELSGVTLGPVMSISEVVSGSPMPVALSMERVASGGGSISPGEVEIGYTLQVVYFIEP